MKRSSLAVFLWLITFASLVHANATLAQDVLAYDWISLLLAGGAGALGGIGRTMTSQLMERSPVLDVKVEAIKDILVALMGGLVAYIVISGYNSIAADITIIKLPVIVSHFRLLIILYAGWSRGKWLKTLDEFAADAIANARKRIRGGDVPPSSLGPLDTPK